MGGVEQVKEQVRDVRTGAWLDKVAQDCRFALRMLIAVRIQALPPSSFLTLALGIAAANTTVLSWMSATLPEPGSRSPSTQATFVTIDRSNPRR